MCDIVTLQNPFIKLPPQTVPVGNHPLSFPDPLPPVVAAHGEAVGEELLADDELEVGHLHPLLHFLKRSEESFHIFTCGEAMLVNGS